MMLHHSRPTNIMEAVDITEDRTIFASKEGVGINVKKIGEVAVAAGVPVI